jgi:iron complex outermembrane receptor protein
MHLSRTGICRQARLVAVVLLTVLSPLLRAQNAPASAAAAVTGRVLNVATGQYLNNARVSVRGTDLAAFTDQTGTYRLPQVPAGAVTLDVFYTGLDPQSAAVTAAAGQTVTRDFDLTSAARYGAGGVVKLDAFTVATVRETDATTPSRSTSSATRPTSRTSSPPTPSAT